MSKNTTRPTVTPYKAGEYCIYVGPRTVQGYKGVKSYDRGGHHLCQIRQTDGGYIYRVPTDSCSCRRNVRTKIHKSGPPKRSRKKTRK